MALTQRTKKIVGGAVVGALIGSIGALLSIIRPAILERGELWTYDVRARAAQEPGRASKNIVIVEIGEEDIANAEAEFATSWPWPRAMYGYLTDYFVQGGAKAVVFDWLFQDRGSYPAADAEEFAASLTASKRAVLGLSLDDSVRPRPPAGAQFGKRLTESASWPEAVSVCLKIIAWNARCFAVRQTTAIGASDSEAEPKTAIYIGGKPTAAEVDQVWERLSVVEDLSEFFQKTESAEGQPDPAPSPPDDNEPAAAKEPSPHGHDEPAPVDSGQARELSAVEIAHEVTAHSIVTARDGFAIDPLPAISFPIRKTITPPLAMIAAAPARLGGVFQATEADGILRRHAPFTLLGGKLYPSLAMAAYLVANPSASPSFRGRTLHLNGASPLQIPLDSQGRFGIRFFGSRIYPRFSAYKILASSRALEEGKAPYVPLETFRDKIVIVAATAQALRDIRVTPVSQIQEGAEVQALALDNLQQASVIVRSSPAADAAISFFIPLLLATGVVALVALLPSALLGLFCATLLTILALWGYFSLANHLFSSRGLWLAVATPVSTAAVASFASLLVATALERQGRRFVQEALGRYTSAELVRELIAHPEYLSLEWGEQREMSVYFSDIAGFTTISESLPPKRLVALLNDYLTNMTDIVLEHGGVVDKYIGDAVMAFWGAPIKRDDHAKQAVLCAIAMRKRCAELREKWRAEFGFEVLARAGVNSGPCVVGNMGSKHKYNYTVMGDTVNVAARLEGANKPYGTFLMISESTCNAVRQLCDVRELDFMTVKGKDLPVRVYEVLDSKGQTAQTLLDAAAAFERGLVAYRAQDWNSAETQFQAALEFRPQDGPSLAFIERCSHFRANPPPKEWEGVWHMKEK